MAHHGGQEAGGLAVVVGVVLALGAGGCGREALDRGDLLLDQGRPAEAIAAWQEALAERPRSTKLLLRIATAQSRLGRFAEAEATVVRAAALEPRSPKIHQHLGLVYLKQKQLDKALGAFHKVLELQPTYPETNFFIGMIHEARGDQATAERYYVRDVNNGPSRAWYNLARMNKEKRDKGLVRGPPSSRAVLGFSLALLVVAAAVYGLRLYLERRRDPISRLPED